MLKINVKLEENVRQIENKLNDLLSDKNRPIVLIEHNKLWWCSSPYTSSNAWFLTLSRGF